MRYVCPKCGSTDKFATVTKIGVLIRGDGDIVDTTTVNDRLEIYPDSPMGCFDCDCRGVAKDFVVMEDEDGNA